MQVKFIKYRIFFIVGLMAFAATAAVLSGYPGQEYGLAVRSSSDVETYHVPWSGSVALDKRRNALAFLGIATAFLTTAIAGTCAISGAVPPAIPFCLAAIGTSVFVSFIFFVATAVAANTPRSLELYSFDYARLPGGPSLLTQVKTDFEAAGDGLPIEIGHSDCVNFDVECHRIWYSRDASIDGTGRDLHRLHVTPAHFDFRAPKPHVQQTDRPTAVLKARQQSTFTQTAQVQTQTNGATEEYYGGYVFEMYDDEGESAIAGDADSQSDALASADDLLNEMSDQYTQQNGKWNQEGTYCMSITDAASGSVGTGGYFWIYSDPSEAISGEDEVSFLQTCGVSAY